MDLNDKIIIKVQFKDETRKMPIHNEEITYDELLLMMERVFKHKLKTNDDITIKYKDDEGDLITLDDDSDLSFALASSNILRLILSVPDETETEETNDKPLSSADVSLIRKELQDIRDKTNKLLDKLNGVSIDSNAADSLRMNNTNISTGDYHGLSGKEFDPLSNSTQQPTTPHQERSASVASMQSTKQDDLSHKMQNTSIQERSDNQDYMRQQMMPPKNQGFPNQNMPQTTQPNYGGMPGMAGRPGMPPTTQSGMPQNMTPNVHQMPHSGMPPNMQPGMPPNMPPTSQPGMPPQQHGMPPNNQQGMPPTSQHGMPPNMPPTSQPGMLPNMPPTTQGMPPTSQQPRYPMNQPGMFNPATPPGSQNQPRMMPPTNMSNNLPRPCSFTPTTSASAPSPMNMRGPSPNGQIRPMPGMMPPPTGMSGSTVDPGNYFNPQQQYQQQSYQK